jgi:Fe-Mn family superoxide dismutase
MGWGFNMSEVHENKPNETAAVEESKTFGLNRRSFLQTAGVAVAGAAAGSIFTGARAEAQEYPGGPKLIEKPLKASTLETEGISRRTHEEHYKLYQGYVKKTNEILDKLKTVSRDPAKANQSYSEIRELKVELTFALGGVKNHELYFDILGGGGSKPEGALLAEINKSFGSPEAWAADLKATGIAARGWVWTAYDYDLKQLVNYIGDAQNTFPMWNATPIIGLDVYEHAYYLDFATKRADYIDAFLRNLNWNAIGVRFGLAKGPASTLITTG